MPWTDGATNTKLAGLVVAEYGATCWLCGEAIDLNLPRRHPLGLSLDHVRPRSKGGDDSIANLRPAHLRCNLRRGARRPNTVRASTMHQFFRDLAGLPTPRQGDSRSNTPEKTQGNRK